MMELLASIYAAQVAAGLMAAWPWFFNAYVRDGKADRVLGTSMFSFVLTTCAGRTWFWINLEIGHPAYQFLSHVMPQMLAMSAICFLLVASSRCAWLGGRWWIPTTAVTVMIFLIAQAV